MRAKRHRSRSRGYDDQPRRRESPRHESRNYGRQRRGSGGSGRRHGRPRGRRGSGGSARKAAAREADAALRAGSARKLVDDAEATVAARRRSAAPERCDRRGGRKRKRKRGRGGKGRRNPERSDGGGAAAFRGDGWGSGRSGGPRPRASDYADEFDDSESSSDDSAIDDSIGHYAGRPGDTLGRRYRIVRDCGLGTFGRVITCEVLGAAPSASSASTSAGGSSSNSVSGGAKPKLCAVKVIRAIRRYSESARIEVDIITKINARDTDGSSHNVRMLDWFEYDGHVCLVFEQLGRSLYSFLKANAYKPYPLRCIADFAAQLVDALHFLHVTMGLVHTDLKPENILLVHSAYDVDSQTGHRVPVDTRIKLIDFGGATFDAVDKMKSSIVNTRQYRAPEVIFRTGWSFPCDCWSLGCILVELYTGNLLFGTHDSMEHVALMELTLQVGMPRSFATGRDARSFFTRAGLLRWPEKAPSQSSCEYVARQPTLRALFRSREDEDSFGSLISGLLTLDPRSRITTAEARKLAFVRSGRRRE